MAHWFSTRLRWGVTRRLWCAVVAVALVVGLAGLTVAQADDDHDQARAALRAGEVLPLQTVLNRIATAYPGRVLAIKLERDDGVWVYEVKLLQSQGRLLKLDLDARTGAVLRQRQRRYPH